MNMCMYMCIVESTHHQEECAALIFGVNILQKQRRISKALHKRPHLYVAVSLGYTALCSLQITCSHLPKSYLGSVNRKHINQLFLKCLGQLNEGTLLNLPLLRQAQSGQWPVATNPKIHITAQLYLLCYWFPSPLSHSLILTVSCPTQISVSCPMLSYWLLASRSKTN